MSDRPDYRQLLAHHVTLEWSDALPAEFEPTTRGRLPPAFTGLAYDVVLLDHEVQGGLGLDWLADLKARPAFPPIAYFAPPAAAVAAASALAAGAIEVLPRAEFEHAQLSAALRKALALRHNVLAETSRAALERAPPESIGADPWPALPAPARVGGSSSVFWPKTFVPASSV